MTRLGNQKIYLAGRKVHMKGKGVTDILLDGGKGGQSFYPSVEAMKTVNGNGVNRGRFEEARGVKAETPFSETGEYSVLGLGPRVFFFASI